MEREIPDQVEPVNQLSEGEQRRHFLHPANELFDWGGGLRESVKMVAETPSLARFSGADAFSEGLACFEAALKTEP